MQLNIDLTWNKKHPDSADLFWASFEEHETVYPDVKQITPKCFRILLVPYWTYPENSMKIMCFPLTLLTDKQANHKHTNKQTNRDKNVTFDCGGGNKD